MKTTFSNANPKPLDLDQMIGENIKKIRLAMSLSQDKLSKKADISYSVLVKIEQGETKNPGINNVLKIAKALGVSVEVLCQK